MAAQRGIGLAVESPADFQSPGLQRRLENLENGRAHRRRIAGVPGNGIELFDKLAPVDDPALVGNRRRARKIHDSIGPMTLPRRSAVAPATRRRPAAYASYKLLPCGIQASRCAKAGAVPLALHSHREPIRPARRCGTGGDMREAPLHCHILGRPPDTDEQTMTSLSRVGIAGVLAAVAAAVIYLPSFGRLRRTCGQRRIRNRTGPGRKALRRAENSERFKASGGSVSWADAEALGDEGFLIRKLSIRGTDWDGRPTAVAPKRYVSGGSTGTMSGCRPMAMSKSAD